MFGGGIPVFVDGVVIGAVGASAGTLASVCSARVNVSPAAPDHLEVVEGDGQVSAVASPVSVPPKTARAIYAQLHKAGRG